MKSIIVYYSMGGNVAFAADYLAKRLDADTLRIEPKKTYPNKGIKKFLWGGKSAVMAETPELIPYDFDAAKYDRVIIAFPVWASNVAPPIRTFVEQQRESLKGKRIAAVACQSGNGAEKAFLKLKDCIGISEFEDEVILIDPKDKPSEDNQKKMDVFLR